MNTTMNRTPLSKAALLTTAFAVTSGLGGIVQASTAVVVSPVVVAPAKAPHEELRHLTQDIMPHAQSLADSLEDTYLAMSQGEVDLSEQVDHAEAEAMVKTLRQHEVAIDRIMESSEVARDILLPLRKMIAKARSNASIVASLARQEAGEFEHFAGQANPGGLKALARANTDIVFNRLS